MLKAQDNKSVFNEVIRHRAAIIQDFFKAYLAENVTKGIQIKDFFNLNTNRNLTFMDLRVKIVLHCLKTF